MRAINSALKSVKAGDLGAQLDYGVEKMTKCESKASARKCCREDGSAGRETPRFLALSLMRLCLSVFILVPFLML